MLSGEFDLSAAAQYLSVVPICLYPEYGPILFGVVTALCFFIPGLKYHRIRLQTLQREETMRRELESSREQRGEPAPGA
jgi:serine/threonine-protein kinase